MLSFQFCIHNLSRHPERSAVLSLPKGDSKELRHVDQTMSCFDFAQHDGRVVGGRCPHLPLNFVCIRKKAGTKTDLPYRQNLWF
jgi:hypothetical protein